jgi:hypothetical protein
MMQPEIRDDGFRVTDFGSYRWRVNPSHEQLAVREIRSRWKRESEAKAA